MTLAAILDPVADLSFAQPARRNLLAPISIALLVLAATAFLLFRLLPRDTAEITVPRVTTYASHLVFKSDSIVVGRDQTQDTLYTLVTVRITDHLKLPLFLKDFTATLTMAEGSTPPVSAIEKGDLPSVFATFPAVQKLAAAQGVPPLYRETQINPGQTIEGYLLLQFPVTEKQWNERQAATLSIDLYHQSAITVEIPKLAPTTAQPPAVATPPALSGSAR